MSGIWVRTPVASTRFLQVKVRPATSTVFLSITLPQALRTYSQSSCSLVWTFMRAWAPARPSLTSSMQSRIDTFLGSNSGNHSWPENHLARSSSLAHSERMWWGTQASWGHDPPRNGHFSLISGRPPRARMNAAPNRPAPPPPRKMASKGRSSTSGGATFQIGSSPGSSSLSSMMPVHSAREGCIGFPKMSSTVELPNLNSFGSIGLRQAQRLLGHEVQDHLPADRRGADQPGQEVQVGQAVLAGQTVTAVDLHGLVDGGDGRFSGGVLGHVRCLARFEA